MRAWRGRRRGPAGRTKGRWPWLARAWSWRYRRTSRTDARAGRVLASTHGERRAPPPPLSIPPVGWDRWIGQSRRRAGAGLRSVTPKARPPRASRTSGRTGPWPEGPDGPTVSVGGRVWAAGLGVPLAGATTGVPLTGATEGVGEPSVGGRLGVPLAGATVGVGVGATVGVGVAGAATTVDSFSSPH